MKLRNVFAVLSITAMSANVMGAGYEKVVQWSAKWSGVAGAATGAVTGADALYFNPAGISRMSTENQFSGNLAVTQSQFEGPIVENDVEIASEPRNSVLPGFLFARKINDKLAVSAGYYVAGGTGADFGRTVFNQNEGSRPEVSSSIALTEWGLGAAYNITDEFSFGAAVRFAEARGALSSGARSGGNIIEAQYTGLEDDGIAWRAGLQYMTDSWGIGLNYRSQLGLTLEGDGTVIIENEAGDLTGGVLTDTTIANVFPEQWSLGGFFNVNENLTIFTEAVFTDYSRNFELDFNSTQKEAIGNAAFTANALAVARGNLVQNWDDQWNFKLGAEYEMDTLTYRLGYALTTQVTPDEEARATFSSPGNGHTFTGGVGKNFNNTHMFDVAFDYSSAEGSNSDTSFGSPTGDYSTSAFTLYTSYVYNF